MILSRRSTNQLGEWTRVTDEWGTTSRAYDPVTGEWLWTDGLKWFGGDEAYQYEVPDPFTGEAGTTQPEQLHDALVDQYTSPEALAATAAQIPTFAAAYASNDPAYAAYWSLYGPFPSDPAAQMDWMLRAQLGGAYERVRQDQVASDRITNFVEGAMLSAAAAFVFAPLASELWAGVTGASGSGSVAVPTGGAVAPSAGAGAIDVATGEAIAAGWEGALAQTSIQNAAIAEVTGQVASGTLAATIGETAASAAIAEAAQIVSTGAISAGTGTIDTATGEAIAEGWESTVADTSIQNAALAEVTGQVPAGTLAKTIGDAAANVALDDALQTLTAGAIDAATGEAIADSWESAVAETSVQNAAIAEVTGQVAAGTLAKTIGESAATAALTEAAKVVGSNAILASNLPSTVRTVTSGGGGLIPATITNPSYGQVLDLVGKTLSVGGTLYRYMTASDANGYTQLVPQEIGPDLREGAGASSVAGGLVPWGLLVAAAIAISAN